MSAFLCFLLHLNSLVIACFCFHFQAYFIGCVWSCYKILVNFHAKQATSGFLFHVHSDEKEVNINLIHNFNY